MRRCGFCEAELFGKRPEARYCDDKCRRAGWAERTGYRRGLQGSVERLERTVPHDPDTAAYAAILLGDPCAYCGSATEATDHIEPRHAGGDDHWTNLTATCRACNSGKPSRPLLAYLLRRHLVLRWVAA